MTFAALTVALMIDTRREHERSYPANWGYDKNFEN